MTDETLLKFPHHRDVRWSPAEFHTATGEPALSLVGRSARRFTIAELAALDLAAMPNSEGEILAKARKERWRQAMDTDMQPLSSKRDGTNEDEFDPLVLPLITQLDLAGVEAQRQGQDPAALPQVARQRPDGEWEYHWFLLPAQAAKEFARRAASQRG